MLNLVIIAHPDDEVLGFGGTGALCVAKDEVVQPVILCGSVDARTKRPDNQDLYEDLTQANHELGFNQPILGSYPNIRMNTVAHLEIVQFIEAQIELFKPDRIFTHHPSDLNDDHKQVSHACMAASRLFQRKSKIIPLPALYFMEILSSTDWAFAYSDITFNPNIFIDISETINKKIKALSFYRNVMRPQPHPRSEEVLKGHAAYRGGQSGFLYAESFQQAFRTGF